MKIKIIQINGNEVVASTGISTIRGTFYSRQPLELKEYNVEMDFDDVVKIEKMSKDSFQHSIYNEKGNVCLHGFVECVEDGVVFLRLNNDLIMLEIKKQLDCSAFFNQNVKVTVEGICMYDID